MPSVINPPPASEKNIFDDDDDDGWQDMPVVRDSDEFAGSAGGLDREDQKKYHYVAPSNTSKGTAANARGDLLDFDDEGAEWRQKAAQDEGEYTRLRGEEEDDGDEVHLRTRYLFDEDKAMTPLNQMQATKGLLTEAQRIAYVGLCHLVSRELSQQLRVVKSKELAGAIKDMEVWAMKIMARLYYHMEVARDEQKMIESLGEHGVRPDDLVPALMTTHTVANPEYDPAEAKRQERERAERNLPDTPDDEDEDDNSGKPTAVESPPQPPGKSPNIPPSTPKTATFQTTARVLEESAAVQMPGVSTTLSAADERVTLDIRWTVLCDLFLILVADSVYDARSRVLLEQVALRLGLGWLDVTKFERRVTEALEMQESVEKTEQADVVEGRKKSAKKRRYVMMGLATLGGGLVIGLSAGLLAPVIGAGIGTALATVGVTGTTAFLGGAGGAAVITTGGILTGSGIAARGMARRTQLVKTFDILPLHNNKRVNCILTVPGFMTSVQDDVRLPFSVLDPVVGDVFSVLWEPEMITETGNALRILTSEVLSQLAQTALQATVMTALMTALQWPIILTKLGYLIDNPWSNALDRAKLAGHILADVLIQRHLGVRPITLIGFSLGARVIFYALLELARQGQYGVVQDVILLGATVTAPKATWHQARSVVAGRFVNGYARNDWVLNYLFRATSGGLNTVAGLRPVDGVPGMENVDVTDKISGHMSYRTFMPLILDQLGFPVSADYFDEPVEPDFTEDRIVVREGEEPVKKGWFGRRKKSVPAPTTRVSRPPSAASFPSFKKGAPGTGTGAAAAGVGVGAASATGTGATAAAAGTPSEVDDDDLPPRLATPGAATPRARTPIPEEHDTATASVSTPGATAGEVHSPTALPIRAGFDFAAIKEVIGADPTTVRGGSGGGGGSSSSAATTTATRWDAVASPTVSSSVLQGVRLESRRAESAPPPEWASPNPAAALASSASSSASNTRPDSRGQRDPSILRDDPPRSIGGGGGIVGGGVGAGDKISEGGFADSKPGLRRVTSSAWPTSSASDVPPTYGSSSSSSSSSAFRAEEYDGEEEPAGSMGLGQQGRSQPPHAAPVQISFGGADGSVWGSETSLGYESPALKGSLAGGGAGGLGGGGLAGLASSRNPFAFGAQDVTSAPGWADDPWSGGEDVAGGGAARGGPSSAARRNPWEG